MRRLQGRPPRIIHGQKIRSRSRSVPKIPRGSDRLEIEATVRPPIESSRMEIGLKPPRPPKKYGCKASRRDQAWSCRKMLAHRPKGFARFHHHWTDPYGANRAWASDIRPRRHCRLPAAFARPLPLSKAKSSSCRHPTQRHHKAANDHQVGARWPCLLHKVGSRRSVWNARRRRPRVWGDLCKVQC